MRAKGGSVYSAYRDTLIWVKTPLLLSVILYFCLRRFLQRSGGSAGGFFRKIDDGEKSVNNLPVEPIAALTAGVLVLIYPKILNYVVAAYLIVTGGSGLLRHLR
jgi:hypothetical protein